MSYIYIYIYNTFNWLKLLELLIAAREKGSKKPLNGAPVISCNYCAKIRKKLNIKQNTIVACLFVCFVIATASDNTEAIFSVHICIFNSISKKKSILILNINCVLSKAQKLKSTNSSRIIRAPRTFNPIPKITPKCNINAICVCV